MKFITGEIGNKIDIEAKLRNADEAIIAVAYFRPRDSTMVALKKIPKLRLIFSQEYQNTDPEKLWELVSRKEGAEAKERWCEAAKTQK